MTKAENKSASCVLTSFVGFQPRLQFLDLAVLPLQLATDRLANLARFAQIPENNYYGKMDFLQFVLELTFVPPPGPFASG